MCEVVLTNSISLDFISNRLFFFLLVGISGNDHSVTLLFSDDFVIILKTLLKFILGQILIKRVFSGIKYQ